MDNIQVGEPTAAPEGAIVEKSEAPEKEVSFKEALKDNMEKADKNEARRDKAQETKTEARVEAAKQPEVSAPIIPPADMTPAEAELFKKMPAELQSYQSRRAYENRAALSREMQAVKDRAKHFDSIEAEIAPHRQWMATRNIREQDLVRRSIAWEQRVEEDRIGGAREWLQAQGIDPYELLENGYQQEQTQVQQQYQQQYLTPQQADQMFEERLHSMRQQDHEAQTTAHNYNVVEKFKADKPLFRDPNTASQLEAEMAPHVAAIAQSNPSIPPDQVLERAYNMITKSDQRFASVLDSFGERQRADKARAEAEKASLASRSISGGLAGASRSGDGLNFRDELRLRMKGGM